MTASCLCCDRGCGRWGKCVSPVKTALQKEIMRLREELAGFTEGWA